jgi:hypothetical protein
MKGLRWRELDLGVPDLERWGLGGVDCWRAVIKGLGWREVVFSEVSVRVEEGSLGVPDRVRSVLGVLVCCKAEMKGLGWRGLAFSSDARSLGVPDLVRSALGVFGCCKAEMKGLGWRELTFSSVRVGAGSVSFSFLPPSHGAWVVIDEAEVGDGMSSAFPFRLTVAMGITRDWWIPFLGMTSGFGSVHWGVPLRLLFRDLRESGRFMVGGADIMDEWSEDSIEDRIDGGMDDCTEDAMEE